MELEDILIKIINGRDTFSIKKYEEQIEFIAENNFQFLIINLTKILIDEKKESKIRVFSSLLIRNLVKKYEIHCQMWTNLEEKSKFEIKNDIITSLASPLKEIVNACSSTIASMKILYFILSNKDYYLI
jgi:hypothetical protein